VVYQTHPSKGNQWVTIVIRTYKDILLPILQGEKEFNGRLLDAALHKNKKIKANLQNYLPGTYATGIMCHNYRPKAVVGSKSVIVNCYLITIPFHGEPPFPVGKSWFDTLPTTTLCISTRAKCSQQSRPNEEEESEKEEVIDVDNDAINQPQNRMEIEPLPPELFDSWADT